ncbi:related to Low affinity vacuolar monovalent cation/H(+) antiporter [Hanseniaspora guilliermondii]|uniref:Related to Low affinity vacuolar monovalent cation/H(+) antiporter n=1 Tax=Hanseniaspora guilliermondii TaxID=56406 RepID=A0A1L0D2W3_9ASCO|nr:related to Low affinity vacuolar monovalent cation/H(+) antiporter [Hanseniaspora guilliermondii]
MSNNSLLKILSDDQDETTNPPEDITLQDRQDAINNMHPFGIKIWKPALYKKDRSIDQSVLKDMYNGIDSTNNLPVTSKDIRHGEDELTIGIKLCNVVYCLTIGLSLSLVLFLLAVVSFLLVTPINGIQEAKTNFMIFYKMINFILYPFGRVLYLDHGVLGLHSEYGAKKTTRIGTNYNSMPVQAKYTINDSLRMKLSKRWSSLVYKVIVNVVLRSVVYVYVAVLWLGVVSIPMSHMLLVILSVLKKFPLSYHVSSLKNTNVSMTNESQPLLRNNVHLQDILICTYKWCGWKYYKLTIDGTNVIVMNLLLVVGLTILDFFYFKKFNDLTLFVMCLISTFPLSFYIGGAIASISISTSMALGSVINALFSTIIEIFLYAVALNSNKGLLVEGGIIGSLLAGTLCLPGLSMLGGSLYKKTQLYNPKSAGVSSAMLIFAILTLLIPSWFYIIYGGVVMICDDDSGCRFENRPLQDDDFFKYKIRPLSGVIAVCLALVYLMGLWFTLKTHASMIWTIPNNPKVDKTQELPVRRYVSDGVMKSDTRHDGQSPARMIHQMTSISSIEENIHGHDAPNWTKVKSFSILLTATILYSVIAEILIHSLDFIIKAFPILTPKFLGVTVFALVPNLTEFLNAYSFARNGNVALSMEIGAAYVLQVVLLQVPALVIYSICKMKLGGERYGDIKEWAFTLVFPKFDLMATLSSVFLFTYLYSEGKSNYLKGALLLIFYAILIIGLYIQSGLDFD